MPNSDAPDSVRRDSAGGRGLKTEIYGLYGITHGWGRLLTVMSAVGRAATAAAIDPGPDVAVVEGEGRLTQYHEKREGALARLVDAHGIQVLSKAAWDAKKKDLGARIW